jgi:integrase/recombinase XerD
MNNFNKVNVLFLVFSSRTLKQGTTSLYCRITIEGERKQFSTGISVPLKLWVQDKQRVKGNSSTAELANKKIAELLRKIESIEATYLMSETEFTVSDIIQKLTGKDTLPFRTLMQAYEYKHQQMVQLKDVSYTASTIEKSEQMQKVVRDYLSKELKTKDILLSKVGIAFLNEFELYLKTKRKLAVATSNKIIQKLKAVMKLAFEYGIIDRPAFPNHHFKHERPKVVYLTVEELERLERFSFAQQRLNMIRDIFLFSVYTGLHYIDAMSLTDANIVKGVDGKEWLFYNRQKTNADINIPMLEKAKKLVAVFKASYNTGSYLVPRFSNQKINSYLKEIAVIVGIEKPLTHKVARKTFGSVLLYYNVPMKVVSELMGHSSVIITERHYAQVELKKLGDEMSRVGSKI